MKPHVFRTRVGHDRWLISYADFITLLFGFFVVLYAFAKADQKKQAQIPNAINSAFKSLGVLPGKSQGADAALDSQDKSGAAASVVTSEQVRAPSAVKDDLNRIQRQLNQTLSGQVAAGSVSVAMGREGLVISLREAGFFSSGSATPKPEAMGTLKQIADSLRQAPYDVRVEGHTDNVPIHTAAFDSNWELSAARATVIARLFLELKAIAPQRLSAAGYGEFHPVAANDTAEGRAQNRRVDLVILPRTQIDFSAPGAPKPGGPWRKITDE